MWVDFCEAKLFWEIETGVAAEDEGKKLQLHSSLPSFSILVAAGAKKAPMYC
jgi:hypothetical protein